ncbi:glycosyl hydrolase [Archangium gephyra]|uniref:glycosyl hydrolase n=1 Tax=Archangium gephyra TaxID=48 RepID=UPI003B77E6DC
MRAPVLMVVLLSVAACGEDSLEVLQEEASDCPEAPVMRLGPVPSAAVVLNAYYLQEEATRDLRRGRTESPAVEETLAKASALGAHAVRTTGYNDAADKRGDSTIQVAPLQYDEVSLRGLDLVLHRAAAYGVKLVLPLGNYWDAYGGTRRYVEWAGLPSPVEGDPRFFTERAVIDHYKAHVARLLSRENTFDGLRYGEHPAVLAWELLNEPRGKGLDTEGAAMRAWVDEVAAVVKQYAPGHLVGTGEEGFDTSLAGYDELFWRGAATSPFFEGGSSFRRNTASPFIDFGSVHFYPEALRGEAGGDGPRRGALVLRARRHRPGPGQTPVHRRVRPAQPRGFLTRRAARHVPRVVPLCVAHRRGRQRPVDVRQRCASGRVGRVHLLLPGWHRPRGPAQPLRGPRRRGRGALRLALSCLSAWPRRKTSHPNE